MSDDEDGGGSLGLIIGMIVGGIVLALGAVVLIRFVLYGSIGF